MDFIDEKINIYSELHSSPESEILKNLNRETHANVLMPRMLSGHLQGRMLSMISCMIQPLSILEIGTYTGYSALCLAEGLKDNGLIHTIDINDELTLWSGNMSVWPDLIQNSESIPATLSTLFPL